MEAVGLGAAIGAGRACSMAVCGHVESMGDVLEARQSGHFPGAMPRMDCVLSC